MFAFVIPVAMTENILPALFDPTPQTQRYVDILPFTAFILFAPSATALFLFWAAGWISRGFK